MSNQIGMKLSDAIMARVNELSNELNLSKDDTLLLLADITLIENSTEEIKDYYL